MSIYYFKQYLWYLQNFKNIMKENEIFLKNGTYKIIENYSSIKLIEQGKVDNVDTFNGKNKNNFIDNIIYNFCVKPLDIKNKSYKEFYGTCLVRTSSNEEIKIFDLERKLILTRYNSHSRKNNLIDKREYISRITNIPLVVKENDENCYIIEEMIENKEVDKDFIVREILNIYSNYYKYEDCIFKGLKKSSILECDFFKKIFFIINKKFVLDKIPFIRCHGDLWSANILYDNQLYFIDFEHVNNYSVYYDYMFYIFNEAYINEDYSLLDSYFNGDYDSYILKYLENFKSDINIKNNREYVLLLFIYEFACNRFENLDKRTLKKLVSKIDIILKQYNINLEE